MPQSAHRSALGALALLSAGLFGRDARAQDSTAARPESRRPRQVLSVQPIMAMIGVLSFDYERAVGDGVTVGVGASYWDTGTLGLDAAGVLDARYSSAEAKVRYYPAETVFRGFSLGATLGGARGSVKLLSEDRERAGGVKVGVEADYNWLLGRSRRLAMALGVGGKRIFYSASGTHLEGAYPTSRIAIGWAF